MSKRLTSRQAIERLHNRGHSYADIARAVGRSPDMIRLIRTGKRPGENLRPALMEVSRHAPRKPGKDGKPRPLPAVGTQYRTPNVRKKEVEHTNAGTLYSKSKPSDDLFNRLVAAASEGYKVTLTVVWKYAREYPRRKGKPGKEYHNHLISVYGREPIDADVVLDDLDGRGYGAEPEQALANATLAYNAKWEGMSGAGEVQLFVYDADAGIDVWGDE